MPRIVLRSPVGIRKRRGELIRRYRLARGLALEDVAPIVGTDVGSLSRIERGHRDPSLHQLDRLVEHLGIPYTLVSTRRLRAAAGV